MPSSLLWHVQLILYADPQRRAFGVKKILSLSLALHIEGRNVVWKLTFNIFAT